MRILTFDIEEWFHILDHEDTRDEIGWSGLERRLDRNVDRILETLDSRNLKATFFVLGWVAREYPSVVRAIDRCGHEIGSHSDRHQLVYQQSPDLFREDLRRSFGSIADLTGDPIRIYRAPGFSIGRENSWAFEVLIEEGIEKDSSIFPAPRAHGGFPGFGAAEPVWLQCGSLRLKEFPINLAWFGGRPFVFSGGGYFRLLPKALINRLIASSPYVMTYFHPRDFDAEQPVLRSLNYIRRFKSYYGLAQAMEKLESVLDRFPFVDLRQADARVDWNSAHTVKVSSQGITPAL